MHVLVDLGPMPEMKGSSGGGRTFFDVGQGGRGVRVNVPDIQGEMFVFGRPNGCCETLPPALPTALLDRS
jgi:hypothetical protein